MPSTGGHRQQVVGCIGLGAMGLGMARQLLSAGYAVRGFDLDGDACAALASSGGTVCASAAEAGEDCELLFIVVFTAAQARDVLFGAGGAAITEPVALDRGHAGPGARTRRPEANTHRH